MSTIPSLSACSKRSGVLRRYISASHLSRSSYNSARQGHVHSTKEHLRRREGPIIIVIAKSATPDRRDTPRLFLSHTLALRRRRLGGEEPRARAPITQEVCLPPYYKDCTPAFSALLIRRYQSIQSHFFLYISSTHIRPLYQSYIYLFNIEYNYTYTVYCT